MMSDGTSTQVIAWMINKWRAKINQGEIYNIRHPRGKGGSKKKKGKKKVSPRIDPVIQHERDI